MIAAQWLLAQDNGIDVDSSGGIAAMVTMVVILAISVFMIAAGWVVFSKAGKPGWASIVPIYNLIVLLEITGKPLWWIVLLLFVPCANIIFLVLLYFALAKSFGKSDAFGIGLLLLPFIFFPILAFGNAKYVGPQPA